MRSTLRHTVLLSALVVGLGAALLASGPSFWTIGTTSELLKGTSDGVLIDLNGTISAGPRLTNLLTSAPSQIWSLATGSDGILWAGTGGDGRLIRIRPGQREETVFDAEESNIFAIAVAGTRVYAATGPDGKVYVIDGASPAREFFNPEEKYIWALAVDGRGRLWVGAGNPAVIYRVEADGTSHVVYRPPAAHVIALTRDASGRMLAGTESPGRVYRFDSTDRPFVLLDAGQSEVRSIVNGPRGVLYVATLTRSDDANPSEAVSVGAATIPPSPPNVGGGSTPPSSGSRRSTIYRIDPNGAWESFWESTDLIYDIALKPDGTLLAASGPEGRLYSVQQDRQVFLDTGVDAKQITRLIVPAGTMPAVIATANPGRVITIGPAAQSPAVYTSPVRDTKSASGWGTIRWESSGQVRLFTRTGNTDRPDESWSDWSPPLTQKDGDRITSPSARFIQWKAELTTPQDGTAPKVTSVTAAYLTRNARPNVTSVTVHPPGVVFQKPFGSEDTPIAGLDDAIADARRPPGLDTNASTSSSLGKRMFQKGLQTISWRAEDSDGDRLSYTLLYRREGDATWHDLKSGLTDSIYVWDTAMVADGRYVIRIVASDEPSNTPDRSLSGDHESDPIDVDNTPPVITTDVVQVGTATKLTVRVHDAHSPIQKVEYSIGGVGWQLIYPIDGLADSPDEQYEIGLANVADASRVLIRATDGMQNVASQGTGR
jgi:hypothetical protein